MYSYWHFGCFGALSLCMLIHTSIHPRWLTVWKPNHDNEPTLSIDKWICFAKDKSFLFFTLELKRRLIITAVSPNVVIDIVLWLKVEKLGLYKGIHTIIIAVTTINDVLSIFCFNVLLGVIFSTGEPDRIVLITMMMTVIIRQNMLETHVENCIFKTSFLNSINRFNFVAFSFYFKIWRKKKQL